ncbi:extracellular solute-binding protein [Acidisoma cellulosilytica]|uniref:Extracellular solute-binding protein n=1 Tax=Acidisoma cellulosilyticum TaxID=2802395 RepID=A0A963Z1X0_9PROT|nr:extracellular solute-binding protein [Acidisoma cellulosilyticum]MCB8881019.1 extracellular solute-binding protein [Acidisoma cellulosilyticum]
MRVTGRTFLAGGISAALALTLGLFAAAPAHADTVLTLVAADYGTGPKDSSQIYWQKIADDFHAANPSITVKVQTVNWNDFDTKIQTMVQNRQYPDITEGDYFSNYAQEGLLYKVSDVMTDPSNLMPAFTKLGSYEGAQYGMPFTTSSRTLFYNKKLFAEAGIAAAPKTWDELMTDAGKITAKGHIGYGMPLGPEEAQAETLLWLLGNGGGYQTADGKWAINSPQNVETLEFMTKLVKAGDTEPNPGTKNRAAILEQFAQGQIGMVNGITTLLPIIKTAGALTDADWGTAPITGKAGPLDSTLGVCDFMAAFKTDGSKQEAIKKFVDFALADQYQIAFSEEYNLLPGTVSGAAAFSKLDPALAPFMAALPKAVQYPSDTVWAQVKTQIQQQIGTAIGPDPKSVLDSLQATAEKGE